MTVKAQDAYSVAHHSKQPVQDPTFSIQVTADSSAAFILKIDNPQCKKLDINIRHSLLGNGLNTTVNSASYGCRYRFDDAEDGKYIVTVSNGKERISKEIEISTVMVTNRRATIF